MTDNTKGINNLESLVLLLAIVTRLYRLWVMVISIRYRMIEVPQDGHIYVHLSFYLISLITITDQEPKDREKGR